MLQNQYPSEKAQLFINEQFEKEVLPGLIEFVSIPNCSKDFDPEWNINGLLDQAADHLVKWGNKQDIKGLTIEKLKENEMTPFIIAEIQKSEYCSTEKVMLFYGHFDKQPPMLPWDEGLGPYQPVVKDGKLYGRGSSDDGYSFFSCLLCVKTLQFLGIPHPRCIFIFEGDEETGSGDVEKYIEKLYDRIGKNIGLITVLDSGAQDYDSMWVTTNLRGVIEAQVRVDVLDEGVHSGKSGILASSFRIQRMLLERIENTQNGQVNQEFQVQIPENRLKEAQLTSEQIKDKLFLLPWHKTMQPSLSKDQYLEIYLNQTWRASLSVIGQEGMPHVSSAGNVLRPFTTLKLSLRIPPTLDCDRAIQKLKEMLEQNPPYGCSVKVTGGNGGNGFNSKPFSEQFWESLNRASQTYYGQQCFAAGEGGSIPFLNFLQDKFPESQFLITGVLGPNSNAHGPNEFLHIDYCKRLICCLTQIIAEFQ